MKDNVKITCKSNSLQNSTYGEMSSRSLVSFASSRWKPHELHPHHTLQMLGFVTRLLTAAPKDTPNKLIWLPPAGALEVNGVQVSQAHPHRNMDFCESWDVPGLGLPSTQSTVRWAVLLKAHRERKNISWDSLHHILLCIVTKLTC